MSSDLLALLPPDALDRLTEMARPRLEATEGPAWLVEAIAHDALVSEERPECQDRDAAYLLVLLIQQARENAALRAIVAEALEMGEGS